eukprot:jgi/Botrbrau1/18301/Bobra.0179s0030.1
MRIWAVSDIHTDYKENLDWCQELDQTEYKDDVLILAGDVTDNVEKFRRTLESLKSAFKHVFFVPGNHDLWVREPEKQSYDSLGKMDVLNRICAELGVETKPRQVDGVWIVPILSWYHASFDQEPDIAGALKIEKIMVDFRLCRWPEAVQSGRDTAVAEYFDCLNEPILSHLAEMREGVDHPEPLISFSHYLPLQGLLPEKRMLYQPNLAKAVGSDFLFRRIQELRPLAHVFGHTHFAWDTNIQGVRYLQWPLAYPRERRRQEAEFGENFKPFLLYDTEKGLSPRQSTYWGDLYETVGRDPSNTQPAPWVLRHLS